MLVPSLYKLSLMFNKNKHVFSTFSINASILLVILFLLCLLSVDMIKMKNVSIVFTGVLAGLESHFFDDHFN